jgi:hypothetical protein
MRPALPRLHIRTRSGPEPASPRQYAQRSGTLRLRTSACSGAEPLHLRTSTHSGPEPSHLRIRTRSGAGPIANGRACECGDPTGRPTSTALKGHPGVRTVGLTLGPVDCAAARAHWWGLRNKPYKAAVVQRRRELVVAWDGTFRAGAAFRSVPRRCRAECEVRAWEISAGHPGGWDSDERHCGEQGVGLSVGGSAGWRGRRPPRTAPAPGAVNRGEAPCVGALPPLEHPSGGPR